MPVLHTKPVAPAGYESTDWLSEVDEILRMLRELDPGAPDVVIEICMGLYARAVEMDVQLARMPSNGLADWVRKNQVAQVLDLIVFMHKSASRMVEVRRQEIELSR